MSRPKDPVTFFIDRCLGEEIVPTTLREAGARVEIHRDHFPIDCIDIDWIPEVAARGWAILTKDNNIRKTDLELNTLRSAKAAAFFLTSSKLDGQTMASCFKIALPRMEKMFWSRTRPLIARVTQTGAVTVQEGDRSGGVKK